MVAADRMAALDARGWVRLQETKCCLHADVTTRRRLERSLGMHARPRSATSST